MNCAFHKEREVRGICSTCGRPVCEECLVDVNGQAHCKSCIEARMRKPSRHVHSLVRFVLSVVPGLGHLYMGLFNRGLQIAGVAVLGGFILDLLLRGTPLSGFLVAAMIFFSIFDAREAHLRLEQGLEVEDKGFVDLQTWRPNWNSKYVGYGLVGIGALALYNSLIDDLLRVLVGWDRYNEVARAVNGVVVGGLAIAAGLWLLRRGPGRTSQE